MDGINQMLKRLNREDGLHDGMDEDQLLDEASPCPFHADGIKCEAVEIEAVKPRPPMDFGPSYRVVYDCTARGPLDDSMVGAVRYANRRDR